MKPLLFLFCNWTLGLIPCLSLIWPCKQTLPWIFKLSFFQTQNSVIFCKP